MNNMHNNSSKRFGYLCFVFHMVATKLTKQESGVKTAKIGNKWNKKITEALKLLERLN